MTIRVQDRTDWFGAWCILVLSVFCPSIGQANPCEGTSLSKTTAELYQRLELSPKKTELRSISKTAARAFESSVDPQSKACIGYIAGSAHLMMSSDKKTRLGHAMQATHWFAISQALNSAAMSEGQAQGRLKAAWSRLGRQKGWLSSQRLVTVELPTGQAGDQLTLKPPPTREKELCQEFTDCTPQWDFPLQPESGARRTSPSWRIRSRLDDGVRDRSSPLNLCSLAAFCLRAPEPVCSVRLKVQHDGKVLPEWQVLDRQGIALPPGAIDSTSSPVTIKARGMQDQRVELAREPTRVVNMEKCLMNIQATTQPPTAKVVGARVRP